VITVGASTDDGVTALLAQMETENEPARTIEMRLMEKSAVLPSPALEANFVNCGLGGTPEEFPKEVSGRIALIQRGEFTFREKALAAQKAGALASVIYNNHDGNFFGSLGDDPEMPTIAVVAISKADGEAMLQSIDAKEIISAAKLKLNPDLIPQPNHLAEFSSRGPNHDGWIKPEITAPGVDIHSATITQAGMPGGGMPDPSGYTSASGTSMATPHVAGVTALILQAHPDWSPLQIKAALVNTAYTMPNQGSLMDQGNGAIQLVKAIDCKAVLVTALDPMGPTHSFGTVVNNGAVTSVTQALTIHPLMADDNSTYKLSVEMAGAPDGMVATLSVGAVGCENGTCTASFDLTVTVDGGTISDGAYYGWVVAEAEWGTLRLPFYYVAQRGAQTEPSPARRESNDRRDHSVPLM
jgi:minor extracellular serine protease Vpr